MPGLTLWLTATRGVSGLASGVVFGVAIAVFGVRSRAPVLDGGFEREFSSMGLGSDPGVERSSPPSSEVPLLVREPGEKGRANEPAGDFDSRLSRTVFDKSVGWMPAASATLRLLGCCCICSCAIATYR